MKTLSTTTKLKFTFDGRFLLLYLVGAITALWKSPMEPAQNDSDPRYLDSPVFRDYGRQGFLGFAWIPSDFLREDWRSLQADVEAGGSMLWLLASSVVLVASAAVSIALRLCAFAAYVASLCLLPLFLLRAVSLERVPVEAPAAAAVA